MPDPKPLPTDGPNIAENVGNSVGDLHWGGEGGVWDGIKKTVTGKNAYETDKVGHAFDLLDPKSIAKNTAIPGQPPGSRQEVIKGNSILLVEGDRYVHITGNDQQFIDGTDYEQTKGDARFVFLANRFLNVQGDEQHLVYGKQDIFVLGPSTQQFVGKHELTAPEEFEWKQFERGFTGLKLDMATLGMDIHASALDVHVIDFELIGFETKSGVVSAWIKGNKDEAVAIVAEVSIEIDIKLRADILIDIGTGTPFR